MAGLFVKNTRSQYIGAAVVNGEERVQLTLLTLLIVIFCLSRLQQRTKDR